MIIPDEPSAVYHANPAIGSGKIRAFLRSPRLFRDRCDGLVDDDSDALLFGIASHLRLLEPDAFADNVSIKPADMSFATKEGKEWRAQQTGRLIITDESAQHLKRMHERMPDEVKNIFATCEKEVTVRTEIDGLAVQCRPDLWNTAGNRLYDLKTIGAIEDAERAVWKHGYHVQLRWYAKVIAAELGIKPPTTRLIFVEKQPPYRWRIVDLDPDYQTLADSSIAIALHGIVERSLSGDWSDPEDLHLIASPPEWMSEHLPVMAGEE